VWLDLAAFQSVCIDSSLSSTGRLRRRDAAVLDKQVAIYERGMSACPASVALAQACVRACEEGCTREQVRTGVHWRLGTVVILDLTLCILCDCLWSFKFLVLV
jgi:hypothetical protein